MEVDSLEAPRLSLVGAELTANNALLTSRDGALLNHNKDVFINPFKKTVLFLTYLKGDNINDWVAKRQKILVNTPNNIHLWGDIRADFINAFKDTGEQIIALLHKLEELKMKQGEVDTYISRFNWLLPLAGFSSTDSGVINMFRRGVYAPLLKKVILHKSKQLVTLKDWQDEVREKQLTYWDAQQATSGTC